MHAPLAVVALASAAGTASAMNFATVTHGLRAALHKHIKVEIKPSTVLPAVPNDVARHNQRIKMKARKLVHSDVCVVASDYDGSASLSLDNDCSDDGCDSAQRAGITTCDANNCWTCTGALNLIGVDGLYSHWSQPYAECEAGENNRFGDDVDEETMPFEIELLKKFKKFKQTEVTRTISHFCCSGGAGICDGDDDYLGEGCGIGHFAYADCECVAGDDLECTKDTTLTEEQIKCVAKEKCDGYDDMVMIRITIWVVCGVLCCCGCLAVVYTFFIKKKETKVAMASPAGATDKPAAVAMDVPVQQVQSA